MLAKKNYQKIADSVSNLKHQPWKANY